MLDCEWDLRFLDLAKLISTWSKDPSTKTGAVIVRPDKTIASMGYNGFPRQIADNEWLLNNRDEKLTRIIHCEMNAVLSARERLDGYTLYTHPFISCDRCCVHMIQAGIKRCVAPSPTDEQNKRWGEAFKVTRELFKEAYVELKEYPEVSLKKVMSEMVVTASGAYSNGWVWNG